MAVAQINTAQADDSDPKWPGISFLYSFPFNKIRNASLASL